MKVAWMLVASVALSAVAGAETSEALKAKSGTGDAVINRAGERIPVIIDTDIGDDIDDAFAVVHAVRSPKLNVLGISTCYGDTKLRSVMTKRLLADAGITTMPIATGIRTESKTSFTQAAYAGGRDDKVADLDAVDFLLDTARKNPGKVTLIAVGPLVNIGAAIDKDKEAFKMFKEVVIMNGSIRRGYDHGDKKKDAPPSSEWNTRNDVESTRKLLACGVPVYMMPLDSTQVKLPMEMRDRIFAQKHPVAQALKALTDQHGKKKAKILYDSVTVAYVEAPEKFPMTPMHITVDDKGFTRESEGQPNVNVCLKTDEDYFLRMLEERLTF